MRPEDDDKPNGMIPDARWVTDPTTGKRRLVHDEVDRATWLARRGARSGWRNGAKVKP